MDQPGALASGLSPGGKPPSPPNLATPQQNKLRATTMKLSSPQALSPLSTAGLGALLGAVAHRTLAAHPTISGTARDAILGAAIATALRHLVDVYALQDQAAQLPENAHTDPRTLL